MNSEQAFDPESYSIFVREVQELLQSISTGVKRPHNHIDLHDLYRYVHTLKGVLAVYSLDAAVAAAHNMEDHLHKLQTGREPLSRMERRGCKIRRRRWAGKWSAACASYLRRRTENRQGDRSSASSCGWSPNCPSLRNRGRQKNDKT